MVKHIGKTTPLHEAVIVSVLADAGAVYLH